MTDLLEDDEGDDLDPEVAALDEHYQKQALFCLRTGVAPSEYDRMGLRQIEVWEAVLEALQRNQ